MRSSSKQLFPGTNSTPQQFGFCCDFQMIVDLKNPPLVILLISSPNWGRVVVFLVFVLLGFSGEEGSSLDVN